MIQPHFLRMRMARLVLSASICAVPQGAWAQNRVEPHLQHLFETAEAHNASLQSLEAASREAQAAVETAKAERLPDVSAQASYCYYGNARLWNRHFGESTSAPMPHWGNNYALKASQVVYSGGAVTASIELSKQGAQMARLAKREVQQNVRFALVGLYLQLHYLQNRERVYQANAELTSQLIDQTRQRRKEGTVLVNDITRYELQQEQMRLGLVQTSDARDIARHQLVTALGVDSLPDVLDGSAFKERPTASLPAWDAWQRVADGGHATLEKERLNVSMSQTKLKLERAAQLPKLALVAEDHLDGPVTIEVPPLNKNLNYWFVGVGVSYNISSLYKNNRRIRQAKLATATSQAQLEDAKCRINDAVQQACVNYRTAESNLRTQQKSVELARQNYQVISHRYANGLALVTDMTDAASVKLNAELALADAEINLYYCYYAIRFAAGNL